MRKIQRPSDPRNRGSFFFLKAKSEERFGIRNRGRQRGYNTDDNGTNRNRCIQEEGLLQARRRVWIRVGLSLSREGCRRSRPKGTPAILFCSEIRRPKRRKNVWRKEPCPECAADIPFAKDVRQGAIIQCPYCWAELVVCAAKPLTLEPAPEEAEYWEE